MSPSPTEEVFEAIVQANALYHRLILIVGRSQTGKTQLLHELETSSGYGAVNLNLELARRMREIPVRKRPLRTERIISEILAQVEGDVVLVDNTEMLFDPSLKLDPLRVLQGASRNRTVVASWSGRVMDGKLVYGDPEHPEFRRYPAQELLTIPLS